MWSLVLVVLVAAASAHDDPVPKKSIKRDVGTKLVIFGTRHGNRNPEQFVLGEPKTKGDWGYEGSVELTQFGKRQGYGLGRSVRSFVGDLVNANYLPKEAKFYSSSANRCQMTLQTAVAGLYNPVSWADWKLPSFDQWSPVPYSIDDPLLRMYAVENCPASDAAWKPISEDTLPELKQLTAENKELLQYIAKNTGWKPSISNAADLADNIIEIELYKSKYPAWIEKPTLGKHTKQTLIKAIMAFAENHQNACAEYGPCREMMGGVWLKHVVDSCKKAAKGEGPKIIGYASHTEVTLAVMKLLGIDKDEITTSAGFVVELRTKPTAQIRLLNHDPNPIDDHVIYQAKYAPWLKAIADADGWVAIGPFEKAVGKFFIKDWQAACGRPSCKQMKNTSLRYLSPLQPHHDDLDQFIPLPLYLPGQDLPIDDDGKTSLLMANVPVLRSLLEKFDRRKKKESEEKEKETEPKASPAESSTGRPTLAGSDREVLDREWSGRHSNIDRPPSELDDIRPKQAMNGTLQDLLMTGGNIGIDKMYLRDLVIHVPPGSPTAGPRTLFNNINHITAGTIMAATDKARCVADRNVSTITANESVPYPVMPWVTAAPQLRPNATGETQQPDEDNLLRQSAVKSEEARLMSSTVRQYLGKENVGSVAIVNQPGHQEDDIALYDALQGCDLVSVAIGVPSIWALKVQNCLIISHSIQYIVDSKWLDDFMACVLNAVILGGIAVIRQDLGPFSDPGMVLKVTEHLSYRKTIEGRNVGFNVICVNRLMSPQDYYWILQKNEFPTS